MTFVALEHIITPYAPRYILSGFTSSPALLRDRPNVPIPDFRPKSHLTITRDPGIGI